MGARLESSGKPQALEGEGDFARATLTAVAPGALRLSATPRASLVRAGCARIEGLAGSLVHARLAPAVVASDSRRTGDAVFVLDTSLSQRTRLAVSCGRLLRAILEQDATLERFRVLAFDVKARELTSGWTKNTPAARGELILRSPRSGSRVPRASRPLSTGSRRSWTPGEHATFFLLSDAQLTWGVEEPRELERAHPRLFARALDRLSDRRRGVESPAARAADSQRRAVVNVVARAATWRKPRSRTSPRRSRSRASGSRERRRADVVVAGSPRALFPGQEIEVAFRLPEGADPRTATIVLETGAGALRFPLAHATLEDSLAGRAWAELVANQLLELEDERGDAVALALSQRFALANRVASFLILETDAEYARPALEDKALDLEAIARAAGERDAHRPVGAPDVSKLDLAVQAFLASVRGTRGLGWRRPEAALLRGPERARPVWPERLDPVAVHAEAVRRALGARPDEALRVLSSIVEENPRDAQALRLAGFQLLAWGLYEDAASLFARTRTLRPFEPQAWLAEAVALEASGQPGEAAVRYEHVLATTFEPRFEEFAKKTARRLYGRLLLGLEAAGASRFADVWREIGTPRAAFEAILFWNLDDTDVDLHALEASGREVDYRTPRSPSGGLLHWDNTAGLGPEIYTHEKSDPKEVFVHYFGTRSVAGTVPAATLLLTWRDGAPLGASCAVLTTQGDRIPLWRGEAADR